MKVSFVDQRLSRGPYQEQYLQRETCNSAQFLKDISYNIQLDDLYDLIDTCHRSDLFDYCPVILEIKNELLQKHYGGRYLLQVWQQGGKRLFEKALKNRPTLWCSSEGETICFKPPPGDEDSDCFYIVYVYQNFIQRVRDPINDPTYTNIYFNKGAFFIGNTQDIKFWNIPDIKVANDKVSDIFETPKEKICTYRPGRKIHFFFGTDLTFAYEMEDGQLNCASFMPTTFDPANYEFESVEKSDYIPRNVENDPIEKTFILRRGIFFAMAMRKSGHVDIYTNMQRFYTTPEKCSDIFHDGFNIYFKERVTAKTKYIICNKDRVSQWVKTRDIAESFNEDNILHQRTADYFKFPGSFCLYQNTVFVAFGNIVHQFSILWNQWIDHKDFGEQIERVFRQNVEPESKYGKFEPNVITYSGKIYKDLVIDDDPSVEIGAYTVPPVCQALGKVKLSYVERQFAAILFVHLENDEIHVYELGKIKRLGNIICKPENSFISMFLRSNKHAVKFLFQDGKELQLFEVTKTLDIVNKDKYMLPEIEAAPELQKVHAAVIDKETNRLIVIDRAFIYVQKEGSKELEPCEDMQNCHNVIISENQYIYAMSRETNTKQQGLRLYNTNSLCDDDGISSSNFLCREAIVLCNNFIDFSRTTERFTYLKDLRNLEVIPLPHKSTIRFIGIPDRKEVVACKQNNDIFYLLTFKGEIFTWGITTGKLIEYHRKCVTGMEDYQIYQGEGSQFTYMSMFLQMTLTRTKEPIIDGPSYDDFFDKTTTELRSKGTVPYHKSNCPYKLHKFRLVRVISTTKAEIIREFVWPVYEHGIQRIFFNEDQSLLFESLENSRVFMYEWKAGNTEGEGKYAFLARMVKFPTVFQNMHDWSIILSPDFSMYVDIDTMIERFVIKDCLTQNTVYTIPKEAMWHEGELIIKKIFNRFIWVDNTRFKFITADGIERLFNIKDDNGGFSEECFSVLSGFSMDDVEENHYYLNPAYIDMKTSQMPIMKRKLQEYFSALYLDTEIEMFEPHEDLKLFLKLKEHIYPKIFSIWWGQRQDEYKGPILASLPFTYVDWKTSEMLRDGKFDYDELSYQQICKLCLNICPGLATFPQFLALNGDQMEKFVNDVKDRIETKRPQPIIPFARNIWGKTSIHILQDSDDVKHANDILKILGQSPTHHHSMDIADVIGWFVEENLPNVQMYFDSRLIETESTRKIKKGILKDKEAGQMLTTSKITMNEDKIRSAIFQDSDKDAEGRVQINVLDLPKLHNFNEPVADAFFVSLGEKADIELFANKSIQVIIDFKYPYIMKWILIKLLGPFVLFLTIYVISNNWIEMEFIKNPDSKKWEILNMIFAILLLIMACYFFVIESFQLKTQSFSYFLSPWNLIDIMPPLLMLVYYIRVLIDNKTLLDEDDMELNLYLKTVTTFFMWTKALYFLRIFESFAYLIRMIVRVIIDMKVFLLVLLIVIMAFADSFYGIIRNNPDGSYFATFDFWDSFLFAFLLALGDWSVPDTFGTVLVPMMQTLFMMSTLFNLIVMLNLLIAIISETFAEVNSNKEKFNYQEKAQLISENQYLLPAYEAKSICEHNSFLILAREVDQLEHEDGLQTNIERIDENLRQIEPRFADLKTFMHSQIEEVLKTVRGGSPNKR